MSFLILLAGVAMAGAAFWLAAHVYRGGDVSAEDDVAEIRDMIDRARG